MTLYRLLLLLAAADLALFAGGIMAAILNVLLIVIYAIARLWH